MLAPGFNRWGHVLLHISLSRIQPKPLAAKCSQAVRRTPSAGMGRPEGWAELDRCGTSPAFGKPLLGRPYRRSDFERRSAVSCAIVGVVAATGKFASTPESFADQN